MNQKQKRKHGIITKCFSIIFSIILLFSMTTTTFALDGEIGGPVDKTILESYLPTCDVLYNPQELPLYSPFNHEVLYWTLKWPTSDYIASTQDYLAVTTEAGGLYTTYYLVLATEPEGSLYDYIEFLLGGMQIEETWGATYDCCEKSFNSTETKMNLTNFDVEVAMWIIDDAYLNYIFSYVYSVTRSVEGSILNVSQIEMGSYYASMCAMPESDIVQIYWHTLEGYWYSGSDFTLQQKVETRNLNYLVSTSTYSMTALDYFDDTDNLIGFFSSNDIVFTYNYNDFTKASGTKLTVTIPEVLRGSNCPESGNVSLIPENTSSGYTYYLDEDVFNEDKTFLMIPMYYGLSSAFKVAFFVFPDDSEALIYLRFASSTKGCTYRHSYSSSPQYMTYQVLSKIDYDLYVGNLQIGSFDAETTTYNCINFAYFNDFNICGAVIDSYVDDSVTHEYTRTIVKGESYRAYPYMTFGCVNYGTAFPLSFIHGQKSSFSLFRDSNNLGFYTYVSPDLNKSILEDGNSGDPTAPPSGGGDSGDVDFWGDTDKLILDYTGVLDMQLPDEPHFDIDIENLNFGDILELPDTFIIYLIQCVDWFTIAFESFVSTYMSPVSSFLKISSLIFAYIPDFLKFLFLFVILSSLILKILQYSTASVSTIDTMKAQKGGG